MSRFNFCDCPAGFSAAPERHAPDCPGRFGAGKAPTPVPATLPASQPADSGVDFGIDGRSVRVSQEAYSIFLAREAAGREKIEALQLRLNAADQRIDELTKPKGEQVAHMPVERCYDVRVKMIIAFNEARSNGGDLDEALDAAYKAALRFSPHPLIGEDVTSEPRR